VPLEIRRRARAQAPFLTVAAIVAAAFVYLAVSPGHWRRASGVIAIAMLLAAGLRLVLSRRTAGLLAVRGKRWDALCFAVLGVAILIVDIRLQN
jgi:Ca2+/H+ antiporter